MKMGFGFYSNEFFILISILKNNSNKVINKNKIDFSFFDLGSKPNLRVILMSFSSIYF